MASRRFDGVQTFGSNRVEMNGILRQGSTTNSVLIDRGEGFSIIKTTPGLYGVALDDRYNSLEHVSCSMCAADHQNTAFSVSFDAGSFNFNGTQNYVIFTMYDLDDVAPRTLKDMPVGSSFSFRMVLKNTAV